VVKAAVALVVAGLVLAGCVPSQVAPTPTPTARPTTARPRFELASYMYALQTKGKIRIATLDDDVPFSFREPSGSYSGFEADLGRELAKAIFGPVPDANSVIEWISVDRSVTIAALTSAQADIVLARLVAADLGPSYPIDLTDPYFVGADRILVRATNDEIKDLPDLDSMTVCVNGPELADEVVGTNAFAKTLTVDTFRSCLGALQQGQVDAIGGDEAALWNLMKQDPATKLVGRPLVTRRYAIGVKKNQGNDREGFLAFLNTWLAGAIRDGTWARLYAHDVMPYSKETKTSPLP
jgi:polar amino acid transport system substrate-binding protein